MHEDAITRSRFDRADTTVECLEPCQNAKQRRFAAAVGADDSDSFATLNREFLDVANLATLSQQAQISDADHG